MLRIFNRYRKKQPADYYPLDEKRYRELRRRQVVRLFMTYLAPFVILTLYLYVQYRAIVSESRLLHLRAIAESQANTLDLFLSERLINLSNVIDDPKLPLPPTQAVMEVELEKLRKNSATFVDLGYFDASGLQTVYVGPYPSLARRDYASEAWFSTLKEGKSDFVITDIYLGFRKIPHFTIGMSRIMDGQLVVLRATLTRMSRN